MLFTWMGLLGAWLAFIMGVMRVGTAWWVISMEDMEAVAFYTARYFGTKTAGEAFDQGFIVITCAVGLGILAEISRALQHRTRSGSPT